jgi:multicomponent Na+:H+ antiporter subunit F
MTSIYLVFVLFLLLNLAGGLVRIARGPTRYDRLLSTQLFGTTAVAALLVLAEVEGRPGLRDVAVVFAVLAAFNIVVFVRAGSTARTEQGGAG